MHPSAQGNNIKSLPPLNFCPGVVTESTSWLRPKSCQGPAITVRPGNTPDGHRDLPARVPMVQPSAMPRFTTERQPQREAVICTFLPKSLCFPLLRSALSSSLLLLPHLYSLRPFFLTHRTQVFCTGATAGLVAQMSCPIRSYGFAGKVPKCFLQNCWTLFQQTSCQ